MRPDPALLAASAMFAGASGFGSIVAIRHEVPGRPFGIGIPLSVPSGLLAGWGAGVAAPWPMPAAGLIVAAGTIRGQRSTWRGLVCMGLGLGCIAGTLIEPVTYRPRACPPAVRAAIALNLGASVVLAATGRRHLRQARR